MIPHLYTYLHRHTRQKELVLPSNEVRQETENKCARDELLYIYIYINNKRDLAKDTYNCQKGGNAETESDFH